MNQIQKSIFFVVLSFGMLTFQKHSMPSQEELLSKLLPFQAKYQEGFVYIGTQDDFLKLKNTLRSRDVFVLDERDEEDPNMVIFNSYKIQEDAYQTQILKILNLYEELYPSDWNRSIESMKREWKVHNLFYHLRYKQSHTKDVDFNNADESLYLTLKKK